MSKLSKERKEGVVVSFSNNSGYGFISPYSGEKDIFFNIKDLKPTKAGFVPGAKMTYIEGENNKGPAAKEIEFNHRIYGKDV